MAQHLTRELLLIRFLAKVEVIPNGCWLWTAATQGEGYSYINASGFNIFSGHRASYFLFVGPVPDGLVVDHLCGNRLCVNPAHLEAVTQMDNVHRGKGAHKDYCKNGHAMTPENTYSRPGTNYRGCQECKRVARRKHYYAARNIRIKS